MLIIENQYFPPISSIKILSGNSHIGFPLYDKFRKMSFQNRCIIPTANGITTLSIPLSGGRENNQLFRDVRIDNTQLWQTRHWRTITSAYNRSPFFEYYEPGLEELFRTRFEFLHHWNKAIQVWLVKQLGIDLELKDIDIPGQEITKLVLPRNYQDPDITKDLPVYRQVFTDRHGFIPNMSSLDLLCCVGNNSASLLELML